MREANYLRDYTVNIDPRREAFQPIRLSREVIPVVALPFRLSIALWVFYRDVCNEAGHNCPCGSLRGQLAAARANLFLCITRI